jgi:small-conductance mechanosensitive channel
VRFGALGVVMLLAAWAAAAQPREPQPGQARTDRTDRTDRTETSPSLATVPEGVPITYRGREVFRVYQPMGSLSVQERARIAEERIDRLVSDYGVRPEEIRVVHAESASEIWAGEQLVALITDKDAAAVELDRRVYADRFRQQVIDLLVESRREFSIEEITRGLVYVAIVTALLLLLSWLVIRLARRLLAAIDTRLERLQGLTIQRLELVSRARLTRWLGVLVRAARGALLLVGTLLWLEVVFSALPWTRPYARLILPWLKAPFLYVGSSLIAALPNVFYIAVIAGVTLGVMRLVHLLFRAIENGAVQIEGFQPEWADPTYKLARVLLIAVAFVAAFPYIPGSASPAFQGVSLFLGLLVSLSSSSAIANIIAGTILTYTGAFRMGDRVAVGETTGDVVKKSLLTTHLRTIKNEIVAVPNSLVLGGQIVNYTTLAAQSGLILHTTVTIGYDAPWRTVHQLLISAALATDGIEATPAPFVFQTALNDFYVSYEINAYTRRPHEMAAIYADLHASIQDSFNKGGVEIMSPHYSSLRDGNTVTIPAAHRESNYEPGRFGVDIVDRQGKR